MPPEQTARAEHPPRLTPQLLVGVLIIAIGILLTLDNLHVLDADRYLRFWPAGLIAVGLVKLWRSRDGGGMFAGIVLTTIGSWLLLDRITVIHLDIRQLWPALLVLFGGFLVWHGLSGPRRRIAAGSQALVNATAVLGGVVRGNNSAAFRGGELTAVLGGCELDLRHAAIDGEAVIDVFAMWGGIEIRVPEDWAVSSRITALLGGVEDKTRPPQGASRHHLILRGFVVMAGVEIKN